MADLRIPFSLTYFKFKKTTRENPKRCKILQSIVDKKFIYMAPGKLTSFKLDKQ